jgi:hypothetical protein
VILEKDQCGCPLVHEAVLHSVCGGGGGRVLVSD